MVYLLIHHRNHEVVRVMGQDVKQFKSLEGFLESGPQFVLQSYIILLGHKKGFEDFHSVDARKCFDTFRTNRSENFGLIKLKSKSHGFKSNMELLK